MICNTSDSFIWSSFKEKEMFNKKQPLSLWFSDLVLIQRYWIKEHFQCTLRYIVPRVKSFKAYLVVIKKSYFAKLKMCVYTNYFLSLKMELPTNYLDKTGQDKKNYFKKLNLWITAPKRATPVNYTSATDWQIAVRRDKVISITLH